jgi:hypothetical protein
MPPTPDSFNDLLEDFLDRAIEFVPETRRSQTARRWITPSHAETFASEQDYHAFLSDIEYMIDDFLLSAPSASGSTAFDRMARVFRGSVQEARAIAALRDARFRLFRTQGVTGGDIIGCADLLTGEAFRLFSPFLAAIETAYTVFGRLAEDNTGLVFHAGEITPLDDAAHAVATGPACPARFSRDKESRWVEAVYMHVVRNGTVEIPGLNAPSGEDRMDILLEDLSHPLLPIVSAWDSLGGAEPDAELIDLTRRMADRACTVFAVRGVHYSDGKPEFHRVFQRIALLLMETIRDQEAALAKDESGALTLNDLAKAIAAEEARTDANQGLGDTFAELCRRLPDIGEKA